MEYISYGTGRVVFKFDENTVVKIPYNVSGREQNRQEYNIYMNNITLGVYGQCSLDVNDWLYMEYLDDCSIEYYNHEDEVHCSVYDDSTEKKITFTCKGDCVNCKHNTFVPFTADDFAKIKAYKTKDRVQIGRDASGVLKFYDYATILPDSREFIFDKAYLDLFNEYLAENNYSVMFVDWIEGKELPQAMGNREAVYKHANRFKRKMFIKNLS